MTRSRAAGVLREVMLTVGAVAGVVCLVSTAAGMLLGVTPLVFRSGSMAPAIETGDLAVARTVSVDQISSGDVVSVVTASGVRVTHRVVSVGGADGSGDARRLVLKGDANDVVDDEEPVVASVERVVLDVPKAGYVVDAVTGPVGLFVVGVYVAVLLGVVFRRDGGWPGASGPSGSDGPRRRADRRTGAGRGPRAAVRTSMAVASAAALVGAAAPAVAAPWTDQSSVTGTSLTAYRVAPPASVACTGGGVLASLTYTWPNTDLRHQYVVTLEDSTGTVRRTDVVANSGSLATSQSVTYSFTLLNGIVGVPATVTVRVTPRLTATPAWVSQTSVTSTGRLLSLGVLGLGSSCT